LSTDVQTAVGTFVWHENKSNDVEKAKDFYTQLLGWELEVWKPGEVDYPMIKVGDQMHGGFSTAQGDAPSHWLGHVLVTDVDETARRAEAAGGRILFGPEDMPEIGRFALIADPQGATISLHSPEGDAPIAVGTFVWDELVTSDVDGARSFYTEVIGWTTREMDMGPEGTYTIFQRGETDVAGCMAQPEGMQSPPQWLPYIATDDVDATVGKATDLGATAFMEATDIPNVGRIAVLQDPVGAVFGLFKPSSEQ
jgi:predicted enzyme related to lactoylglutathione lyase